MKHSQMTKSDQQKNSQWIGLKIRKDNSKIIFLVFNQNMLWVLDEHPKHTFKLTDKKKMITIL